MKNFEAEKENGIIPELHNRINILSQENERVNHNLNDEYRKNDEK